MRFVCGSSSGLINVPMLVYYKATRRHQYGLIFGVNSAGRMSFRTMGNEIRAAISNHSSLDITR